MSAKGQKATCAPHLLYSPKADMCVALAYVCFGPLADIAPVHSMISFALPISVLET
jgi:hypothetical protein